MNSIKEKIEQLEKTFKLFGRETFPNLNFRNIIENLTTEEMLDNNFEKKFLPLISSNLNFQRVFTSSEFLNDSKAQNSESFDKILNKFTNILKKDSFLTVNLSLFSLTTEQSIKIFRKAFEEKITTQFGGSLDFFINVADKIMIEGSKEDYDFVYRHFSKSNIESLSDYNNYPLVIINENISRSEKIEIIKSNYRQKDIHKYTNIIKTKIKDLNNLDDFIEATIIQNNRIKNKSNNITDLIKRVFLGIRGDWSIKDPDEYKNFDEFFEKYLKYLSEENFDTLVISAGTGSYKKYELLTKMFKSLDFYKKLEIANKSNYFGSQLLGNINDIKYEELSQREKEKFAKFISNEFRPSRSFKENSDKYMKIINEFPDFFIDKINQFYSGLNLGTIYLNRRSYYGYSDEIDQSELVSILKKASENFMKKYDLVQKEIVKNFGFNQTEKSWMRSDSDEKVIAFFDKILPAIVDVKKSLNDEKWNNYIYERYIKTLEDDDFMDNAFTSITEILNNIEDKSDDIIVKIKNTLNLSSATAAMDYLFGKLKNFVVECGYEYTDTMEENINKLKQNILFISAL